MTEPAPAVSQSAGDIVARASKSYRVKWCIMGLAVLGWGLWSIYDGYVAWPEHNRLIEEADRNKQAPPKGLSKHTNLDITLNRLFGIALPPVGLFLVGWAFYSSRGEYRLSGDTLHAPGHPPIAMGDIRAIDQTKWDRKGIAYIEYEARGTTGRLKLDDYLYERGPTDQIYDRILATVAPEEVAAEAPTDATPS